MAYEKWYSRRWALVIAAGLSVLFAVHVAANIEARRMNKMIEKLRPQTIWKDTI